MLMHRTFSLLRGVLTLGVFAFILIGAQPAKALLVYTNDFEGVVGPEWSDTSINVTPAGARKFLGQFGNQTVRLTLMNLPPHTLVTVSFDLFIIQSWDGNNTTFGPDVWELRVDGGPTLLHTTFSNAFASETSFRQAYPDEFPGGDHPGLTGAAEHDTLGYPDNSGYSGANDAVYQLHFTFPHTASTPDFSDTSFQRVLERIAGQYPLKVLHEQGLGETHRHCGMACAGRRWAR
jgi:hypothetical protein